MTEPASGARGAGVTRHPFDAVLAWYFVLVWGSGYLATRMGVMHAPPFTFLSLRFGIAALFMLLIVAWVRPAWPVRDLDAAARRTLLGHLVVAGLLMHAINLSGSHYGQFLGLSAGTSALLLAAQPLLTAALAGRWLGQPAGPGQWLGVCIGFGGVAMVVAHKIDLAEMNAANLAAVSSALIAITVGTLYQRRFCAQVDLRLALLVQLLASWAVVTPLAFAVEGFHVAWSPELVAALAFLIVFASILANVALHTLMRHGEATRVTSLMYLTPLIAVALERWLFGVVPTLLTLAGGAVTCVGVALTAWRAPRPAPATATPGT
ncbi:MAG: DMT family transporter [Proteobacteria bacterium]|nr:DMT family transporter [Burkholderiales bacterium]